jgi:hypothetical protein
MNTALADPNTWENYVTAMREVGGGADMFKHKFPKVLLLGCAIVQQEETDCSYRLSYPSTTFDTPELGSA